MKGPRFLRLGAGLAAFAFVCAATSSCAGPRAAGPVDGGLAPCSWAPNCACTQEEGGPAPLVFDGDAADALARLLAFLESSDDVRVERVDGWYVHAVFSTPTLGFRDDVELLVVPDERVVHVRSASRLGLWDLGANARRIEHIRADW